MGQDILTKLNYKKKMWISPKHPFYFESDKVKILYSACIFMHAQLNKTINTLNNFELQRLLTKGLGLTEKEIAKVICLAKEGRHILDDVINILDTPLKKYILILDLSNVCMRNTPLSEEELQSIHMFAEVLSIQKNEEKLLYEFIKYACSFDTKKCILIFEKMLQNNMEITMSELKYYIPEIAYVTQINSKLIKQGTSLRLVDNCELRDTIIVNSGTTLHIANANLSMYGTIIVDGGKLIIQDSKLINKSDKNEALILVKKYSEVEIYHSLLDCSCMGGAINQKNGNLIINDSRIINTTKFSAVKFFGKQISIQNTYFYNCFCIYNGGALWIQHGSGVIKSCTFEDCEAKNGGAIYTLSDQIMIVSSHFISCKVVEYGASIYYNGEIKSNVVDLDYTDCYPEKEEIVQYIGERKEIAKDYVIKYTTILDVPITITELGTLIISNATLYVKHSILCRGMLTIKNARIVALDFSERDLIIAIRARGCTARNSEFDGRLKAGIIRATGTKITIDNCTFRNTSGGRAIYDAYEPIIQNSIFSYCLSGAVYTNSGRIMNSSFINCRDKSGAGILMYGLRGQISNCKFIRCISDYNGGAIDKSVGHHITECEYEGCKPNNVS